MTANGFQCSADRLLSGLLQSVSLIPLNSPHGNIPEFVLKNKAIFSTAFCTPLFSHLFLCILKSALLADTDLLSAVMCCTAVDQSFTPHRRNN